VPVSRHALISVAEARELVRSAIHGPLDGEDIAIDDALDRVLAEQVTARGDVPPFPNSAMDGFALRACPAGTRVRIAGESRAGHPSPVPVGDGEAIRISTGAVVPDGAEAVLELERAAEQDGWITTEIAVDAARNVRGAGDDIRAGQAVLEPGTRLGPAELGVAVAAGRAPLRCARRPRVALVVTGDELVSPGADLGPGQIHDSNATTLTALARRAGAEVLHGESGGAKDTPAATSAALRSALDAADVVVVSGGVSVGPHDHVKDALGALGAEECFWGVSLKPGRPTWFGVRDGTLVFGLPGNPVSAMVTFLLFVRPALSALQGAPFDETRFAARLATDVARNPVRDEAIRVHVATADGALVATPTGPQDSHILTSMLAASGLATIEAGEGSVPAGTEVTVEPIR
jgi:molybdopterin molybdotransferase